MSLISVELRVLREKFKVLPGRSQVKPGDRVLIATQNGLETGVVVSLNESEENEKSDIRLLRILNEDDYRVLRENKVLANKVFPEILREIRQERLKMDIVSVSYTYDRQKIFIYYTAPDRVDFRNLIRQLGGLMKIRVQMVQIGARDEAAIKGGLGICGREVCCKVFLKDMESVNIDMARKQGLSLNPENISGSCGRLICCLRYENSQYENMGPEDGYQDIPIDKERGRKPKRVFSGRHQKPY